MIKNQDCTDNIDWADQTLQTVAEAAEFGSPEAKIELDKRRKAIDKLGTVTPKFSVTEDED
jgi:hypothetical protein